jgi:zinc D-Ala-D-Ala dipeptidase
MRLQTRVALIAIVVGRVLASSAGAQGLPAAFVYLRDIDPTIAQDMRYAGSGNFVGRPLPGYEAAECVLLNPAARALAAVQTELAAHGMGLKVYDCYRPARAVRAMVNWASDGPPGSTSARFYPHVAKGDLLRQGYIASQSAHSTGLAVDLTLAARHKPPETAALPGPCRGPADDSLDMGTTFDCFDPAAHTTAPGVSAEAGRNRALLVATMRRHGFANYRREWWHFTFQGGHATRRFDFPITARPAR